MSDTPQGEGWWLASDGKYYPPQPQPPQTPPGAPQWGSAPLATATPVATTEEPKKKRGCLIAALVGGAILVALLIVVAIASGSDDDGATVADSATDTTAASSGEPDIDGDPTTTAAPETPPAEEAPAGGSREQPLTFGEAHNIGDGWTVRVGEFQPDASVTIAESNMFNDAAPEGQQYVLVRPEATYNGEDTRTAFDLSFSVVGASGVTYDSSSSMCVPPDPQWWSLGEAFPGGTLTGNLCIAVPVGDVDSLVLIAEPTFALSGNRAFLALR